MTEKWNSVTAKVELTANGDGVAIVHSLAKVKVEAECVGPTGSADICFLQPKIEEVDDAAAQELVDAAVTKARRLAAPKEVSRGRNRRMYRPSGREKNGIDRDRYRRMYRPGARENYGVDRDSGNLSPYHRSKLRYLLSILSQRRKWHQASGLLGVLLGIPYEGLKPTSRVGRWSDFAVAMEVLRRVDQVESKDLRVRRMFRVLSLRQPNARSRANVQLELALYLISGGDFEAAYDELRPIVDGKRHRDDPVANLCHGLNSYRLWYEKCMEEVSKQVVPEHGSRLENAGFLAREGTGENNAPEASDGDAYPERIRTSQGSHVGSSRLRYSGGFRAAVPRMRGQSRFEESGSARMELDTSNWLDSQRSIYEETDELGFVQTGEEFWRSVTVPWSSGLDRQLFPIQIQREVDRNHYIVSMNDGRTRDLHAAAVKHLKQTLSSAPGMLPALLPLVQVPFVFVRCQFFSSCAQPEECLRLNREAYGVVNCQELVRRVPSLFLFQSQLLLAVHDIKGAVDEIDKCSQVLSKHFIPPSIKAALLESLDKKDPIQLAACYRDVLIRNPLSLSSLKGLVNLHESGNLETSLLLEYICLHLDVDSGVVDTWKKLACCFLELEERLQQPASSGVDIKLEKNSVKEQMEEGLRHPTLLERVELQQSWSSRYRWWLKTHFHTEVAGSEDHVNGDQWLLAYKASCAAHIYGSGLCFVEHACQTLEKHNKHRELDLVKYHCERALELFGA